MHSLTRPGGILEQEPIEREPAAPSRLTPGSSRNTAPAAEEPSESSKSADHGDLGYLRPDPEPSLAATPRSGGHVPLSESNNNQSYASMTPAEQRNAQQQYRNSFTQGQSEAFNKFAPEKQQKLLDQRTPLFVQRQNNASVDSHLQGLKSKVDQHLADPDVSEKDKQELKSHWGSAQESVKNAGHMSDEKEKASFYGEARKHVGNVDSKVGQLDNQKTRRDEFDKGRPDYKVFPHGGKHDPSTNKKVGPRPTDKELIAGTANGKAALYKTSNAREVNGMEKEAWVKGHELGDNFTAVHKMSQNVGASDGEMTPYIRMDGAHHGHPITQKEFKTKMQKDIDGAKTAGDQKKLDQIRQYLTSIKEEPQFKS